MESRKHTKELREDSSAFPLGGIKRVTPHTPPAASTHDGGGKEAPYLIHALFTSALTHSGSLYKQAGWTFSGTQQMRGPRRQEQELPIPHPYKETHHESLKYILKQARLPKKKKKKS